MTTICIYIKPYDYIIILLWLISIPFLWTKKQIFSKGIETQARIIIAYFLTSAIILFICIGDPFKRSDYIPNLVTELVGIFITVFLIDRIYKYISTKNEELYGKLAMKNFRMPIFTYCANWLYIYEPDNKKLDLELSRYTDLDSFFRSNDFYNRVISYDFNKLIGENKTYAQYYNEKMLEIMDRFQSILAKYASKLSLKNIQLIEYFGGKAYIFTVFAVMKFISEVKFTSQLDDEPAVTVRLFNNSFKDIKRENFQKHFVKLVDLINQYNNAVENDYEKWTIKNISKLQTIKSANDNPATEW